MSTSQSKIGGNRDQRLSTQESSAKGKDQGLLTNQVIAEKESENGVAFEDAKEQQPKIQLISSDGDTKLTTVVHEPSNEGLEASQTVVPSNLTTSEHQQGSTTWPGETFDLYKKIAKLQHRFFGAHTRLNFERDAVSPKLNSLNASISRLTQLLAQSDDLASLGSDHSLWTNACNQFNALRQSFEHQMQVVDDHEQRLDKLLYKLAKLEPEFLQVLDAYFKDGKHIQHDSPTSSSSQPRGPSPTSNHLEQRYYDKREDVQLLRERLINHRKKFQTHSDRESALRSPPKEDQYIQSGAFRDWWDSEYEGISKELHDAEEQLARLWDECQEAQLDVGVLGQERQTASSPIAESPQLERQESTPIDSGTPPFLPHDRHGVLPGFLRNIRWSKERERVVPLVEQLVSFTGKRDFIEDWVGKIPRGSAVPPGPAYEHDSFPELDRMVSPPRSDPGRTTMNLANDDVDRRDAFVMVPSGVSFDPNCEPGPIRRWYQRILRPWRSDEALGPRFQQDSQVAPIDEYVKVPNGVRIDPNFKPGRFQRFYRWALFPWRSNEEHGPRHQQNSANS